MRNWIAVLLLLSLLACQAPTDKIEYQVTDQGVLFTENGENVLFYQRAPKSFDGEYTRNNYVHPLWSMDGDTLTEDYPPDHAHHRGIFWTWHQIYVGDTALGDAWECRDFVWDITDVEIDDAAGDAKLLTATVLWKSPAFVDESGEMIPAVKEVSKITVYPKSDEFRIIDFEIELLALQAGVTIGGSDDHKGYGGFSPRIKLPDDLRFTSTTGAVEPTSAAVPAGPWMDMTGTLAGKSVSGISILVHPGNPQPITNWILRRKKSMQNPVYPGRERVAVSTTQPTVLKYRLIVHRGDAGAVDVQRFYDAYQKK